jgi:hypothetical protein
MRSDLAPEARVVLFFEPRSYYFSGIDTVPYHLADGSPLLVALHAAIQADAVPELFASLGATHVLLETRLKPFTTPQFTPEYTSETFAADVRGLERFLRHHATPETEQGSLELYRLKEAS